MSLYTFSRSEKLPSVKQPAGLHIKESTDIELLASMGETTTREVTRRLANDHLAFVAFFNGQPAAFGWMARGKATIGELNHTLILPPGNRYLWNFRTLAANRGLGIYPALLQYIMQYEGDKASRFWVIHAPENGSSERGIVKAGFRYVGKLYADSNGAATLEVENLPAAERRLLGYMDIRLSEETGATCWNCSSPYLKKRTPSCCCATKEQACVGNNLQAFAPAYA